MTPICLLWAMRTSIYNKRMSTISEAHKLKGTIAMYTSKQDHHSTGYRHIIKLNGEPFCVIYNQADFEVEKMITELNIGHRCLQEGYSDIPNWVKYCNASHPRYGTPWTSQEEEDLQNAWQDGIPVNQLMKLHGRDQSGITSRLQKLFGNNDWQKYFAVNKVEKAKKAKIKELEADLLRLQAQVNDLKNELDGLPPMRVNVVIRGR